MWTDPKPPVSLNRFGEWYDHLIDSLDDKSIEEKIYMKNNREHIWIKLNTHLQMKKYKSDTS